MMPAFEGMAPTVEAAIRRVLTENRDLSREDDVLVRAATANLAYEVRAIMSGRVAELLDPLGEATEWNEAVELALLIIEGAS